MLSGHICRCTGYAAIVAAILEAASNLPEESILTMDLGTAFAVSVLRRPHQEAIVDGDRRRTLCANGIARSKRSRAA